MRGARTLMVLIVLSVVAAGCGARLTPEQREFVLTSGAGGGSGEVAAAGGGTDVAGETLEGGEDTDFVDAGQANGGADGEGGNDAGTAATGGGSGGGGAGGGGGGGGVQDTRAAPPGGNGGKTDTGVTEDQIVIANASDISGAVPGLFEDARDAVHAYVKYFTASEGTIYGRKLKYVSLDTKLTTTGNRNAYIQACNESFAAVGSMSAFEQGAVDPINQCGIPDLRTAAVHNKVMPLKTVYPADASTVGIQPMAEYQYWKQLKPAAVKKSAYLYITSETTRFQTGQVRDATSKIGYDWIYTKEIDISETNYAQFVLEMKQKGVRYVTFQGAYQQASRLAKEMQRQSFEPDIYALQSNTYTPDFIADGGGAVEGTQIAVPSVILEEINQHQELQTYAQWLNQVKPGARPTGLGIYAWASAKMFIDAAKKAGPQLTRDKLIKELQKVDGFTGGDLIPEQDIGRKYPADCVVIVEVKGGKFVRRAPNSGFTCAKPVRV